MFNLLAQTEQLTHGWADLLLKQGPLAVIFVLFVGFLIWYGRRIAEGHIDLVTTLKDNSVKTVANLDKLTETQVELVKQAKDFKCRHP